MSVVRSVSVMNEERLEHWSSFGDASPLAPDEATWLDLQGDDLATSLDRTHCTLGSQRLYARLRGSLPWSAEPALEHLASAFAADSALRARTAERLSRAGRQLGPDLWPLTSPDLLPHRWWFAAFPVLALVALAALVLAVRDPIWWVGVLMLAVGNFLVRAATAWMVPRAIGPARQIDPLLSTAEALLPKLAHRGLLPSTAVEACARVRHMRRLSRWLGAGAPSGNELLSALYEYLNVLFLLDLNLLALIGRSCRLHAADLRMVAEWVGDVDVALAVTAIRESPGPWCRPETPNAAAGDRFQGTGLRHPMIDGAVPNDVELNPGALLVITGANATGKSTYLRTVGIAALLAHALGTCPARAWCSPPMRVRSLLDRRDDLATGRSYFMVEAERVAGFLREQRDAVPTLFLLDEAFRGTNRSERIAGAVAVAEHLSRSDGAPTTRVTLIATHDPELTELLGSTASAWHFSEQMQDGQVMFDYARHAGPATTRTGLRLLESAGAPTSVLTRAHQIAEQLSDTGGLPRA